MSPPPTRRPGSLGPRPAPARPPLEAEHTTIGSTADLDEESTQGERVSPNPGRAPIRSSSSIQAPPIPSPRRNSARREVPPPVEEEPEEPERVKLPSSALRPRPYTKFQWTALPRIPAADVDLLSRVQWILPADTTRAAAAVAERLKQLLEHDCTIKLTQVFLSKPAELRKLVPEPCFLAQVALAPHVPRGILEVELALAHACIDQLLGGAAGEAVVLRQLTDIEEGVLCYLMLEAFKALTPSLDPERPRLRIESSLRGVDEALALAGGEESLVVLQYAFTIGEAAAGYFRLILPQAAVDGARPGPKSVEARERRAKLFEKNRARLQMLREQLRFEIARCELSALDLRGLGPGDVVLVEDPMARPDLGEGGGCKVRVGLGQRGYWKGKLEVGEEGLAATLEELVLGAELPAGSDAAAEAKPSGAEGGAEAAAFEEDALPGGRTMETTLPANPWDHNERNNMGASGQDDGSELLNDIPLHVSVEVARVQVTAEDVVGLRSGQVLQLGRPPTSAVELSVNGKIVAQGELVEVDGQLGVKITQLVA